MIPKTATYIQSALLPPEDRAVLLSAIAHIKTGPQAYEQAKVVGFGARPLDHFGRVVVLTWRGVEVLVLFKRLTQTLEITHTSLGAAATIQSEDDAWTVLDVFNVPIDTAVSILTRRLGEQGTKLAALQALQIHLERQYKGFDDRETELVAGRNKAEIEAAMLSEIISHCSRCRAKLTAKKKPTKATKSAAPKKRK